MIHLDTNYLAWTEFLNGPVTAEEIRLVEAVLDEPLVAFDRRAAELAAQLFNQSGRRRGSRFDCLIAATAILTGAKLATENTAAFKVFAAFGLKLI